MTSTRRDFLKKASALALLGLPLPARAAAGRLTLVKNHRSDYAIVILPNAPPAAAHGALELQRHLLEMSGARLPIVSHEDIAAGHVPAWTNPRHLITIGAAPLAEEEFSVRTVGPRLEITGGGKRGALYGCYALLEDVLGCRWYTAHISRIPARPTIILPALNLRDRPAFEYREPYYTEAFSRDWAVRNRTNGHGQDLDASVGGRVTYGDGYFVHTFNTLVPPDKYFDTHPEYFSLIDGTRRKGYYQLCLTNPDVLVISIADIREAIRKNPDATIFSVSQNDTGNQCQCDNCTAVYREEGAPSGAVLRFVNSVADAIAKDHPHILIDTLAYQWTEDPPKKARPRPNVRVRLAPIGACVGHPIDRCDANQHVNANLNAWGQITHQLYVWHYCTDFANYLQPLPDLDEIAADVPLFHKRGVVGLFYEGDYAPGGGGAMSELKAYLMAKLMWDPGRPAAPIVAEYLDGVYGPAAPQIRQWLDLVHAPVREKSVHVHIYDPPTAAYLSDATLAQGVLLFDAAEQAAASDPRALHQVQRARLALEYVQLMRAKPDDPARPVLIQQVSRKIAEYGITQMREGQPVADFLKSLTPAAKKT